MANFSGKLSYDDGNVAASSEPPLPLPSPDCRQLEFVAANPNTQSLIFVVALITCLDNKKTIVSSKSKLRLIN